MSSHEKRVGDKVGFFRYVKRGETGMQKKAAEGRIHAITENDEGETVVAINFRGRLYYRGVDEIRHIRKPKTRR